VKQSQVNELESDIANLHTQLSDGQTVLSSVKEMLARAQQRLQEAINDVAEKDRQLVETIAQNQAMSQVLEQRKHEDAEVEELRNNLVAKQQSIDSIQSRVTDAEAARQHKEVLEFGARQELDIAREEVKRLKEEVSGLQTMAANAEKNAQAVSAEMQEAMK
jgi:uncharacterized coiled-coil DUF342 family protein